MAYVRQRIRVEGAAQVEEALNDLSKATSGNVLKRAVSRAGAFYATKAIERAPKRSGSLKKNIMVGKAKIITAGKAAYAQAMKEGGTRAEAAQAARNANRESGGTGRQAVTQVGPNKLVGQGVLQEFGTSHHKAQPFMRPTWDEYGPRLPEIMKDALKEEIDKAVARAAKKAAKNIVR